MQDGPSCGAMNVKNYPGDDYEQVVKILADGLLREKTTQKILSSNKYPTLKTVDVD
jgi:hypothetical protein